ncbi:UNVERIFIED_CONTAM: Apoptosis inhibitor 5-like protein API5 [Sesamum radiatum]|uniref:Apoptosis inhibitor 5-like protein API5 n=1 Tax=Sesamum radiatum TaxID=300843 RepID=A0AAW2KFG1_SESRA
MERHITDLIKKSLQDVTGAEFKMFMDFLKSLGMFGEKAPRERIQELIEIIESQADLDAQFNRGASNSKFFNYLNKHIFPVFDKKTMPRRKAGEEMNFTYVECLLYAFHHLAHKAWRGLQINTKIFLSGEFILPKASLDLLPLFMSFAFEFYKKGLNCVEDLARATMKKLNQGMVEHNKALAAAVSDEAKASIKIQKQNTTTGLRTCNNILVMTQPLHSKTPSFIGDKRIDLSWKEALKPSATSTAAAAAGKRPGAQNGAGNNPSKKGRGGSGTQNQLSNRAFDGLSYGGRNVAGRGRGRGGRGRGRGFR